MGKFNALLNLRLKQKETPKTNKMTALAEKTTGGYLSSFSGVFRISKLSDKEEDTLAAILKNFSEEENQDLEKDLESLTTITSEVKAITNQAVMLHGERIKKAQQILKNYKDGAFSAWLIAIYGNRQTPYNFLQYYEFYTSLPQNLQPKIDLMPRQAVYTLASRSGDVESKITIVKDYQGETKQELLTIIRNKFPLDRDDKRMPNVANQSIASLKRLESLFSHDLFMPTAKQRDKICEILLQLQKLINA